MTDVDKLSLLLDDPEVQDLLFGLAHVASAPSTRPGVSRLRAVVLRLADTARLEQYTSWLSDDAPNRAMTTSQVRAAIGDDAIADLADLSKSSPGAVTWQLASVLPDLVDAISPGGQVLDANRLAEAIATAVAYGDRSAGAFGPRMH
jgi:uncharacterized protein YidB (DUF937 family)